MDLEKSKQPVISSDSSYYIKASQNVVTKGNIGNFRVVKKRFVTLIEMMIVMFLIALITGVIAYNYRGSLEEGKAFKTKAGMEKIEMILNLRVAEDPDLLDNIETQWKEVIRRDPLVKDANSLIRDGWGKPYDVTTENNVIKIRSQKYNEYKKPGS